MVGVALTPLLLALLLAVGGADAKAKPYQPPALPPFLGEGARMVETHPEGCPPGWIWYSAEEWWRRELQPINEKATDHGHVHIQGCWPYMLPMAQPFKIPVTTVLYENTGTLTGIIVSPSGIGATGVNNPGQCSMESYRGYPMYCAYGLNRTAASCSSSSGSQKAPGGFDPTPTPPSNYCNWKDEITIDPTAFNRSGLVDLMVEATTVHPTDIVPLQHTTRIGRPRFQGGFLLVNSQPANDVPALEITRARFHGLGWGTLTNYSLAELGMAPKLPLGGMYRVWVNVYPGTLDSQPITRTVAAFDVNNHLDPPVIGNLIMNQTGPFEGQLVLNLTERLASSAAQSWHNLAFQGKTYDGNTSSTNTGVLAIYFEAVNGEPARCGVPIQTHAASDAAVSVVVSNSTDRKSMQPPRVNVTRDTNSSVINLRAPSQQGSQATSNYLELTFDLSFLTAPAGLSAASLWLYVPKGDHGSGNDFQLAALDASGSGATCTPGASCQQVGSGTLPWPDNAQQGGWAEVVLEPGWASRQLACMGRLVVAIGLVPGQDGTLAIQQSTNQGAPLLLLTPACGSEAAAACGAGRPAAISSAG